MQSINEEKKLRGFGDLMDVEKERKPETKQASKKTSKPAAKKETKQTSKIVSKKASLQESNKEIILAPVTWRADRAKVKAIKVWGLMNDRTVQDLYDEALTDLMEKLNIPQG